MNKSIKKQLFLFFFIIFLPFFLLFFLTFYGIYKFIDQKENSSCKKNNCVES